MEGAGASWASPDHPPEALVAPKVAALLLATVAGGPLSEGPRAFVEVLGRSLLSLSLSTLEACRGVHGFVVVAPPGMEEKVAETARRSPKFVATVTGDGARRRSLERGLEALAPDFNVVVCHDIARPLATPELFAAVLRALDGADAVVPRVPVADTVKRVEDGVVRATVPRAGLAVVQTPRAFRRVALAGAFRAGGPIPERADDEISLVEAAGFRVVTVPGDPANLKVSTPEDVRLAEALLADRLSRDDGR